tara:strand:- start:590 stop:997 length:408 start_codon:yes stop_codon:yes gene_type:complete
MAIAGVKIPVKDVIEALKRHNGVKTSAASSLKCSRQAITDIIKREGLEDLLLECRKRRVDMAENVIDNLLKEDHFGAARLVLTTQHARWREKTEVEHSGEIRMPIDTPPAAGSIEEWVEIKHKVQAARAEVTDNA